MDGMQTPGKLAARARQSSQRTSVGGISVGVWAALISVYIVWGSTYLAIREAVRTMPPFLMASARFLVAGGLLYAFAIGRGDRTGDKPGGRQWLAVTVVGGMLLLGGNGGVVWAEQHIPSGIAALLIATVPLWMVLVGAGLFGSRVTRREVLGVLVGFGGVALLAVFSGPGKGHFNVAGLIVLVLASLSWATGSVYSRHAALPKRPMVSTAMQMIAGGVLLGILGVASGEVPKVHLSHISLASWLGLAWLIVFGSWVGFTAYVWLLRNARISLVSTYAYVNPVVAVFLGWLFLSERVTGTTLAAGMIILAAVALIVTASRPPPAPPPEPVPAEPNGAGEA